jgi:hypothetical protein
LKIILGKWTREALDAILREASGIDDAGKRIAFLSKPFLEVNYSESTLIGDVHTEEICVIDLSGVDCFTYLDYVEAMRLSSTFDAFIENVKKVRYRSGRASFDERNHFFTDWPEFNSDLVVDVTEKAGGGRVLKVQKTLNQKQDKTYFVKGLSPQQRNIAYIPSKAIDDDLLKRIQTGDYLGIYTNEQGLDVSHIGILIRETGNITFRHASSRHGKVMDQDFRKYISDRPGIIIVRPKDRPEYDG